MGLGHALHDTICNYVFRCSPVKWPFKVIQGHLLLGQLKANLGHITYLDLDLDLVPPVL